MADESPTSPRFTVLGIHHVGLVVTDLDRSLEFYGKLLGVDSYPVVHSSGERIDRAMQLDGVRMRYAMFDLGGVRLELVQYEQPPGRDLQRRNNDLGSSHVALRVDDLNPAYRYLLDQGIAVNASPNTVLRGAGAGNRYCYFRDPDDLQLEIYEVAPSARTT